MALCAPLQSAGPDTACRQSVLTRRSFLLASACHKGCKCYAPCRQRAGMLSRRARLLVAGAGRFFSLPSVFGSAPPSLIPVRAHPAAALPPPFDTCSPPRMCFVFLSRQLFCTGLCNRFRQAKKKCLCAFVSAFSVGNALRFQQPCGLSFRGNAMFFPLNSGRTALCCRLAFCLFQWQNAPGLPLLYPLLGSYDLLHALGFLAFAADLPFDRVRTWYGAGDDRGGEGAELSGM